MQVATLAASCRTRIPRIFSRGDHLLHDRVQILQPRRTAERLAAHLDVVGYRVVADVNCLGEGVQPVREVELVPRHFAIVVCISELSMHTRVKPKAVYEQLRMQFQRMRDYVVYAANGVINGCHVTFLQAKNDGCTRPSSTSCSASLTV
jgi:hypothetical protein